MIEGAITQNVTMGKPGACPQCGEDNSKAPFLLEQTGADAHCNHEVEYNYSCDNCRCRFDEVWMYSHKEVTRR
jgi:C4-type Zn-finger protein